MSDITREETIRIMQTEQAYANERYATDTYLYYRVDKAYSKAIESLENQKKELEEIKTKLEHPALDGDKVIIRGDCYISLSHILYIMNKHISELKDMKIESKPSELILCKDCKYFEYDSVAQVDGIPLIVAHEICKKWGEGCKTSENGYCFLAELKEDNESEDKECTKVL